MVIWLLILNCRNFAHYMSKCKCFIFVSRQATPCTWDALQYKLCRKYCKISKTNPASSVYVEKGDTPDHNSRDEPD